MVVPNRVSVIPFKELRGASSDPTPQRLCSGLVCHSLRGSLCRRMLLVGSGVELSLIHREPNLDQPSLLEAAATLAEALLASSS